MAFDLAIITTPLVRDAGLTPAPENARPATAAIESIFSGWTTQISKLLPPDFLINRVCA
jgi:hypothetical protein